MYVTSLAAPGSMQRLAGHMSSTLQLPPVLKRVGETLLLLSYTAWHAACYLAAAKPEPLHPSLVLLAITHCLRASLLPSCSCRHHPG